MTNLTRLIFAATASAALASCGPTQTSQVTVHEVQLYGQSAQRLLWAYGTLTGSQLTGNQAQRTITVAGKPVVLTPGREDGSLAMNGQAFLNLPLDKQWAQKVATPQIVLNVDGTFDIRSAPNVSALYYTDGSQWFKLSATQGRRVSAQRIADFNSGWGDLTPTELQQLTGALAGGQPLTVGVLAPRADVAPRATVQPTATDSRLTSLVVSRPAYEMPAGDVQSSPSPAPTAPHTPTTPQEGRVNTSVIAEGTNATAQSAEVQIATTPAQVRRLYATAYGRQASQPQLPDVAGRTLVGIFLGQRFTGGYSAGVTSASVNQGVLTLNVREYEPGKDMMVTQALTSPWVIVAVDGRFNDVRVNGLHRANSNYGVPASTR